MFINRYSVCLLAFVTLSACTAVETHQALIPEHVSGISGTPLTQAVPISVGDFSNRSTYMNGLFSDGTDRLGKQALQILTTHLSDVPDFRVVDRRNMAALSAEAKYNSARQNIRGAHFVISGAVTEFGRRETGSHGLWGLFSKSRVQTLYAKVSLSVVDVTTSQVSASYQGSGEYALSNQEVFGFGSTAGYDSTLADKVLNLAVMEAVRNLASGKRSSEW